MTTKLSELERSGIAAIIRRYALSGDATNNGWDKSYVLKLANYIETDTIPGTSFREDIHSILDGFIQ